MWGKGGGGVIVVDIGLTLGGLIDRRRLGGVGIRLVEGVSPQDLFRLYCIGPGAQKVCAV